MDSERPARKPKPDYPYWPYAMKRRTAAAYLEISEAGIEREVISGRLPTPKVIDGKERWLRSEIDAYLASGRENSEPMPDYLKEFWARSYKA